MKIECPNCNKKEAKISSTYPDIIVCYCGGKELREVGNQVVSKSGELIVGDLVSGVDKSYQRSIYMVVDTFDVPGWSDKGLLLKLMCFNNKDFSKQYSKTWPLAIRPESEFNKVSSEELGKASIEFGRLKDHKNYLFCIRPEKCRKFDQGDIVSIKSGKNKYSIDEGLLLGEVYCHREDGVGAYGSRAEKIMLIETLDLDRKKVIILADDVS